MLVASPRLKTTCNYATWVTAHHGSCILQTGMPMTALSVLGGQFRLKAETRAELYRDFLPWALRAGFRSADLMCLYYEKHFEVIFHEPHMKIA